MTVWHVWFCSTLQIIEAKQLNEVNRSTVTFKHNDMSK